MSNPVTPSVPASTATQSNQAATPVQPAQSTPTPAEVRKMKLKVEGQELELPENEVIALAQQGKAASKRFQEAAQTRKQAEEMLALFKSNPKEAMKQAGLDPRKFSEDTLMEILKEEAMSPEQRKAADNERRLREYENNEKKTKADAEAKALAELEAKHHANYETTFLEALTESGLPRTPFTVKRMAQLQLVNMKKGFDLDAKQLAKLVREDYQTEHKALFGATDGDALMDFLGADGVKKLQKAMVRKLKGQPQKFSKPAEVRKEDNAEKKLTWKDVTKNNRGIIR